MLDKMEVVTDIDIDVADRDIALKDIQHIPASKIENNELKKHNVGVYFQSIPVDPVTGYASIDYNEANERGYFKIDILNLNTYKNVRNEEHLNELISREPLWEMLENENIVNQLFHLNNHFDIVNTMKPRSILELAMVLAMIRPAKNYLIGKPWDEIKREIWIEPENEKYFWKKSHAISYAMVVVVQMNLLVEEALKEN